MLISSIPAAVERMEDRTGDVRLLTLAPQEPLIWRAGQYMHIGVEGYGTRAYSIASRPAEHGHMTFHVRNMGSGLSSYLSKDIKTGDMLALKGPCGDMNTDAIDGRPVLMVAGGTGIAPMLAMVDEILEKNLTHEPITIVYGARNANDIYCQQEIDALRGPVEIHIVTDVHTPDLHLRQLGLNLSEHVVYVSGPDPMMLPVHTALNDLLAERARIFCDADMDILQKATT